MKKNVFLPILIALLAFAQTAWAQQTNVNYIDANGEPQTASAYLITSSNTTLGMQGYDIWYYVEGNVEINSQVTYISNINLILCDGASLTVNFTDEYAIHCSADNSTLTIYGQTNGTGQLTATATSGSGIYTEYFTINGGVINASGSSNGIYANKTLVINRGTVTANGNTWGMRGNVVTINGGNVTANGGGIWSSGMTSTLTIGYTNSSDRIYSTKYQSGYTGNMMKVKSGQYMKTTDTNFIIYGIVNDDWKDAIAGHTLMPYTPTEWSGSGTAQSPYIISSVDDLNLLSIRTNGGTHPYSDTCFKLGANITFTASSDWNDASSTESNFTAIPTFSGHFDGDVYTISGLRIRKDYGVGLFNYLADGAVVENITLSNSRITGVSENGKIGGIVGSQQSGTTVNNCHVTNTVYVYSKHHYTGIRGGVVGYNYGGTISNCVSEATIGRTTEVWDNTNDKAGGIVGVNESGTLTGNLVIGANITCYTENYGAIAGNNESGTLSNNYYRACTVNGTANTVNIGVNGADITTSDGAMSIHTITKPNDVTITTDPTLVYGGTNYWKHGTTITLNGGLGGTPTAGWQKAYCINDVALQENSTTIKNNFDMPAEDVTITIGEIHADWAISNAGSQADPYMIYFTDQLDLLATRVNNGTSTYSGKYFKLMDDLTYDNTEQNNYIAIGTGSNPFSGHFDGNHKTINGIRIYTNSGYQGVFGYIVNAEVKDLYVNDIEITAHDRVGCIVGECNGSTISNCRVTTATLNNTGGGYSDCPYFGGIAGYYMGTSTMSNNFVLEADIPHVYQFGAIAGFVSSNQSLESNYYHNCFKDGTASPTGIGCNTGDVTTNDGAIPVFTVSVPNGVTATATATVTHNTVNYYKKDVPVTLSGGLEGTPGEGLQYAYIVYGETLTGSNLAPGHEFDMQNANAVVTIGSMPADWAVANEGTQADPYKIYYTDQLDQLAARVNNGTSTYSNKYFKLMDDLTYSYTGAANENNYTAIGNGSNPFSGHFDGNQKTIEGIRIYGTGSYQGVFGYINNAEVKNLFVDDIVIAGHDRVGSIVGECDGSSTITGCRVTTATLSVAGDASYQQLFGGIAGRKSGSTMSNNFVLGLTIPETYHFGAITGENGGSSQSMVSNYYHNCTVGSTPYPTGIGCNAIDVEGAKPVFTLTLADGISTDVEPAISYNAADYYENGAAINLSYVTPANPGYRHIYSVNDTPIANYGTSFDISTNSEVTVAPNILINWETEYAGTEADPYLISNVEQWDMLASNVSISGIPYSGEYFKLTENISVTEMVGGGNGSSNVFSGTFDGDGHTITFNVDNTSDQYTAPFRRIDGATIKGIRLNGDVCSSSRFAGGIVAYAKGTSTVTDCVNSTAITSIGENDNSSNGGIVGMVGGNGTINITGCVFNGKMTGVTNSNNTWSGILGLCNSGCTANISHCLVDPVSAVEHGNTIYRSSGTTHCSNCYYTKTIGTAQGKLAYSITGGENVTVEFAGDVTEYNVSEITTYGTGIKYSDVLYAGDGDNVNLTLGAALGYSITGDFSVNAGTLTSQGNYYTLSMPDQNVTISATTTRMGKHFVIAGNWDTHTNWADNDYPTSTSDEVFVFAAATIPGTCCAQAGHITIASEGSLTLEDGAQLIHSNAVRATAKKHIAAHSTEDGVNYGWVFIASPITTELAPTDVTNMTNNNFDLYRFNQSAILEWENYLVHNTTDVPFQLENSRGYLYSNSSDVELIFAGILRPAALYNITLDYDENAEFAGWNLVGNPFAAEAYVNRSYYKMNDNGSAIDPTEVSSSNPIAPFMGIMVKAENMQDDEVTFSTTPPNNATNNGNLEIALSQTVLDRAGASTGSATLDKAIVSFNEGSELGKFYFGEQNANIYIPQGNKDYAIVVSEGQGEMPLNFRAHENGNYTISVNPEGVNLAYLHLIDNLTGADVDLLALRQAQGPASYTFTAKTTDYESRFKLVYASSICGDANGDNETFAFYSNGHWIIANEGEATLQVIDINGRILSSETVKGSVSKTIQATPGVYVLRLINGNDVKTQKIVVR